jgi:YD repeat-containing protein
MASPAAEGVHSNAYNFLSFIRSGVDPRTGTYRCSVSISDVLANALSGPSLPLALVFNPLQSSNIGFGTGWSMQLSSYSLKTRKLNVSTGATYQAYVSDDAFVVTDKKIRDIKTKRQGDHLVIEHKSGIVEVLSKPGSSRDEWLVSKIYSAEGRSIRMSYGVRAGRPFLSEIHDETQRLLVVTVQGASAASIELWPDNPEKKLRFSLSIQNNDLRKITLHLQSEDVSPCWRFEYRTVNGIRLIAELQLPTGGVERLQYKTSALKLPSGAPIGALPAVSAHTAIPRLNQPGITREYSYSSKNYLGYGSNAPWSTDADNLYLRPGNYQYESTEMLILGSGTTRTVVRRTHRRYNRFHLLVSETTNQNGKVVSQITQYNEKPGLTFDQQPANFQLPSQTETLYYDTATPDIQRKEVTLTEFDDYGNPLKKVSPSGITELFEYYPIGASDGCPADSFGVVRWLKQKTVMPAADRAPAEPLITRYRYTELASASAARDSFIALEQESVFQGAQSTPVNIISWQHERDTSSLFFGRITRKTETMQGIDSTYTYRYEADDGVLKTHATLTCGEATSSKCCWNDPLTGQEVRSEDPTGVVIETAYDRLGRKVLETVAPDTPNQARKMYSYSLAAELGDVAQTLFVDARGAATSTRLDGLGREVFVEVQDLDHEDKPMRAVYSATYDGLGQLVQEVRTDWLAGEPNALVTTHLYDDWGSRSASIGPDGVLTHDRQDPVSLSRSQWCEGAGKTITTKNAFGKDESTERFDRLGNAYGSTRYVYDGLGRCVQKTCAQGHITRFTYDFADRLLTTELPDGTLIRKEYVQHSTQDLPTRIWVNDYLAGERTYDGLLRIDSETVGNRTQTFTFEGAQPNPATQETPSGTVIEFKYEPALNNQVIQRDVVGNESLSARFRYDSTHAGLILASSPGGQQQRVYSASGKLMREHVAEGTARFEANHQYSLNGLPLKYTAVCGEQHITRYDALCRVAEVEQGSMRVSFTYDAFGRVSKTEAVDTLNQRVFNTELAYDDFDREVQRKLTVDDNAPEALSQRFNQSDKLVQRTLTRHGLILRDETYEYDPRGRLRLYQCAGLYLPVDVCGKRILSQAYAFDALDNIRQLKTVFEGGENVATYDYQCSDKTQLSWVTHSHPDYAGQIASFKYDSDGHQLNDERGRQLVYDELGRLASVEEVQP